MLEAEPLEKFCGYVFGAKKGLVEYCDEDRFVADTGKLGLTCFCRTLVSWSWGGVKHGVYHSCFGGSNYRDGYCLC